MRFFPGAWGELEWQCVELSMRFMYLAYGVSPYGANGKDVVDNYTPGLGGWPREARSTARPESLRPRVTSSRSVRPPPVRSVTRGSSRRTTSTATGTATIHILSQNDTADGWRVIPVENWSVDGPAVGLGVVPGWLHKP